MTSLSRALLGVVLAVPVFSLGAGCAVAHTETEEDDPTIARDAPFSSDVATLMDFEFDGEALTTSSWNSKGAIRAQMLFTVGQLNDKHSVARLDKLVLSSVTMAAAGGGLYRVRYHAKLPVAWGSKTDLPTTHTFRFPRRVDDAGQATFLSRYSTTCVEAGGHDVNVSNYWYHYRPEAYGCSLAPADVVVSNVTARVSTQNTTSKYPEYHRVWEDGSLDVVAIFGKYEEGGRDESDAGIDTYDSFIAAMRASYPSAVTTPATIPPGPGIAATDITFAVKLSGDRTLNVTAILVDNVRTAGAAFDKRYAELSPGADLIMYNGHAGLGANVRALSTKGKFFPGKYQIFFMDGCDTLAYQDGVLAATRALLNADDPSGTRYMDIVANAMPAYFMNMSNAAMALITSLAAPSTPKTYNAIFKGVDTSQVVVVTGEEDNAFYPGLMSTPRWSSVLGRDAVNKDEVRKYVTETLKPGTYVFEMTPDAATPNGDADLYLRVGAEPALTSTYKCKSYIYNSNERCQVTLTAPSTVSLAVRGDVTRSSKFVVRGFQR